MTDTPGVRISGGGSIAVDTPSMLLAARVVESLHGELEALVAKTRAAAADADWWGAVALADAILAMLVAQHGCRLAADGLRTAALRYGAAEQAAQAAVTTAGAAVGGAIGVANRGLLAAGLPVAAVALDAGLVGIAAVPVAVRILDETVRTGRFAPQLDPVLLNAARLALSSTDDVERAFLGIETPGDLDRDRPASLLGTETTAAVLAGVVGLFHPASTGLRLRAATRARPVDAPRDLASLVGRVPSVAAGTSGSQVRIERYDGSDGRRWIVYIAGTVTFAPASGTEPFDMTSNLQGVAHRPADSETAVLQAMRQAGVQPDEPVLLVGHSQGALDAVRVAQDGGFRVGGVVEVGGPTGQIALPAQVPVLAAEHDEDLVPMLGGVAATGAAGLNRVLVTRSLPDGGTGGASTLERAFPAHLLQNYQQTLRLAQASGDPRVTRFVGQVQPFLDADGGRVTMVRADRVPEPVTDRPPVQRLVPVRRPVPVDGGSPVSRGWVR